MAFSTLIDDVLAMVFSFLPDHHRPMVQLVNKWWRRVYLQKGWRRDFSAGLFQILVSIERKEDCLRALRNLYENLNKTPPCIRYLLKAAGDTLCRDFFRSNPQLSDEAIYILAACAHRLDDEYLMKMTDALILKTPCSKYVPRYAGPIIAPSYCAGPIIAPSYCLASPINVSLDLPTVAYIALDAWAPYSDLPRHLLNECLASGNEETLERMFGRKRFFFPLDYCPKYGQPRHEARARRSLWIVLRVGSKEDIEDIYHQAVRVGKRRAYVDRLIGEMLWPTRVTESGEKTPRYSKIDPPEWAVDLFRSLLVADGAIGEGEDISEFLTLESKKEAHNSNYHSRGGHRHHH